MKLSSNIPYINNIYALCFIEKDTKKIFVYCRSIFKEIDGECKYWVKNSFKDHAPKCFGINYAYEHYKEQTNNSDYIKHL